MYLQSYIRIPADAAWLISAAEHILNAQTLSQYYFDTNPPLCFLIFIPVVWMQHLGLEIWQALHLYTSGLSILSIAIVSVFLKNWPLSNLAKLTTLLFYSLGLFTLPFLEYGQKDHLIAIALLPFLLVQLSITYDYNNSKYLKLFSLVVFTPLLLVKPHYGLLPTCVIAHRIFKRKNFNAIFDIDFIILAIGTILYGFSIFVFFPDFIEDVLPLSLSLYVGTLGNSDIHKFSLAMGFMAFCIAGLCAASDQPKEERTLGTWLGIFALLTVIPYWVQFKGFSLHLVPFNILIAAAFGATLALTAKNLIMRYKVFIIIILLIASYGLSFLIHNNIEKLGHAYYQNHEIAKVLKPTGKENSFYIESNSTTTVLPLSTYLDLEFASRFVANWFTFNLSELPDEQRMHYWQMLGDYYAQDMDKYEPETIMFVKNDDFYTALNTFKDHENFQKALQNYNQTEIYQTDEIFMNAEKILGDESVSYYVYRRIEKSD